MIPFKYPPSSKERSFNLLITTDLPSFVTAFTPNPLLNEFKAVDLTSIDLIYFLSFSVGYKE